ncbi:MAG: class I SAM-dependent methyltransferase [Bdellovibrionales bacterium]
MAGAGFFKDLFSGHAADYAKYRPVYPAELYSYLSGLVKNHDLVLDCGTGNGQAAQQLASHFKAVLATDPSPEQIGKASPHPRIQYQVAAAEKMPLPDHSADMITVAQALHWFKIDLFGQECKRVLRPGGVVAAWGYDLAEVSPAVDHVVQRMHDDVLGAYWEPERRLIAMHYKTLELPFTALPSPHITMRAEWSLEDLKGYLKTWSSVRSYLKKNTDVRALENSVLELSRAWGDVKTRIVSWPLFFRLWRV